MSRNGPLSDLRYVYRDNCLCKVHLTAEKLAKVIGMPNPLKLLIVSIFQVWGFSIIHIIYTRVSIIEIQFEFIDFIKAVVRFFVHDLLFYKTKSKHLLHPHLCFIRDFVNINEACFPTKIEVKVVTRPR